MKPQKPDPKSEAVAAPLSPEEIRAKIALTGNLVGLTDPERWAYYQAYCDHLGLNPITRPFDLLTRFETGPNNEKIEKVTLYANVSCSTQIADKREVSYTRPVIEPLPAPGMFVVWVMARLPNGREEWGEGIVDTVYHKNGRALENAWKRASTQAHRRATLRLCGIALPDESELEDIAGAQIDRIRPPQGAVEIPTATEIFDAPRPLPDSSLPEAWTAPTVARELADMEIANTINAELKEITDEIKAEAPAPDPAPAQVESPVPHPLPERIAEAREKNMPTPPAPPPVKAPHSPDPSLAFGPKHRNHGPKIGARLDNACARLTIAGASGREMLAETNAMLQGYGKPPVATRYALNDGEAGELIDAFEAWADRLESKTQNARASN